MAKKILFTTIILGLSLVLFQSCKSGSDQSSTKTNTVIDKEKITWTQDINEALAQAKASGKLLFVECYSPTCPTCQAIEPYFSTPEIAEKYNTNFVNYKLDVGVEEQVKFLTANKIWLPSFPQFLYFDGDGNLVHQAEVVPGTESIIAAANDALTDENRSSHFKQRFEDGERDFEFLMKYGTYTRLVMDTLQNFKVVESLFNSFDKKDLNGSASWLAYKKAGGGIDNGWFKHWISNKAQAVEYEKQAGHPDSEVDRILGAALQTSIMKDGKNYSTSQIRQIKQYMGQIGAGEYADSFVWEIETLANLREGKKDAALQIGKNMAQRFGGSGSSLVYITRVFNDNFPDNSYVPTATQWLKTANPLVNTNSELAEYNYEVARIALKSNDMNLAKTSATAALDKAKAAGLDLKRFNDLLASIN